MGYCTLQRTCQEDTGTVGLKLRFPVSGQVTPELQLDRLVLWLYFPEFDWDVVADGDIVSGPPPWLDCKPRS